MNDMHATAGPGAEEEIARLREENAHLRDWQARSVRYVRDKVDQLLGVVGTCPLRPEELDDEMLLSLDPVGIVSATFVRILENLRETNEELVLARDEIDAIFQAVGNGIMVLDSRGRVLSYNAKLRELFLPDGVELVGRCCAGLICTPEARRETCVFDQVMHSGAAASCRNWQTGGRYFDVVASPIKNRKGEIEQVVLVYNDITERIRSEQALADAKARLATIFEAVPAGIVLIDAKSHRIVDANQHALQMLELPREKVFGAECFSYICAKDHAGCPITDGGKSIDSTECTLERANGSSVPILKTVAPVMLGDRLYLLESFLDIADRKDAENAVRRALAEAQDARGKMDGILQSVADPLIVTDSEQRIILMNRAAEELLGICLYDSRGLALDQVISDARLLEALRGDLTEEFRVDVALPATGGGEMIYQGSTSPQLTADGLLSGMITVLRNVTREREIERMKSEFVSTAAHELQTPLAAIIGFSELLMNQREDLTPELEQQSLGYIYDKADLLSKIVDDLLDISRIESGRALELFVSECELKPLFEQVVRPYQNGPGPHLFKLHLPRAATRVRVDRRKLEQILDNLLSNAYKYSPEGGMIRMTVQCSDDRLKVSVEDQGIGMTPEQRSRIYDKFYRGDASNTSIGGTGLGMSITKYFVEAHGGRIWVESERGLGTKVSFELPMQPLPEAEGD
jgi:PAS domain S-box-containing protein